MLLADGFVCVARGHVYAVNGISSWIMDPDWVGVALGARGGRTQASNSDWETQGR